MTNNLFRTIFVMGVVAGLGCGAQADVVVNSECTDCVTEQWQEVYDVRMVAPKLQKATPIRQKTEADTALLAVSRPAGTNALSVKAKTNREKSKTIVVVKKAPPVELQEPVVTEEIIDEGVVYEEEEVYVDEYYDDAVVLDESYGETDDAETLIEEVVAEDDVVVVVEDEPVEEEVVEEVTEEVVEDVVFQTVDPMTDEPVADAVFVDEPVSEKVADVAPMVSTKNVRTTITETTTLIPEKEKIAEEDALPVTMAQKVAYGEFVRDWHAKPGSTLRNLLNEWSDLSGWTVVWKLDRDYPLEAGTYIRANFVEAAKALVRTFARATPAPIGTFYQGNRVLVVSTQEDENER